MSFAIAPAGSQYGVLYGFGQVDSQGNIPSIAAPIVASTGERIQFVNVDAFDPSNLILRSAAGFPNAASFPSIPYNFPSNDYSLLGTSIGTSAWATGLISPTPTTDSPCYSAPFKIAGQGTFYFGDVLYYNDYIASPRGVFTVTQAERPRNHRGARLQWRPLRR